MATLFDWSRSQPSLQVKLLVTNCLHQSTTKQCRIVFSVAIIVGSACFCGETLAAEKKPAKASKSERAAASRIDLLNKKAEVRRATVKHLFHSDLTETLLPELKRALKDDDDIVRAYAATAVGNMRAQSIDAVPDLIAQLEHDSFKEARETAARALGRIGETVKDERRCVAALKNATKSDNDPVTRVVSHGALAMMDVDTKKSINALVEYLSHDESLVRMKSAHALGMLAEKARFASARIVAVLQTEEDPYLRGYIGRAVGRVGDPAALPALQKEYKRSRSDKDRNEIRGAIRQLGGEDPEKLK